MPGGEETWTRIRHELRRAVPETTYQLWLEPLEVVAVESGRLVLGAPQGLRTWVAERHGRTLRTSVAVVLGDGWDVDVVALETAGAAAGEPIPSPPPGPASRADTIDPRLTFEQFVIGEGNRMAHAAALTVAELPGQAYNPLYLCGPPGTGKTHLLHAIAHYLALGEPHLRVRYVTAETFTNEFVRSVGDRDVAEFKARYRDVDVLLVDDVAFLEGKARTSEEFFHTFNAALEAGAQLVLTSDRLPHDIAALEDRLRTRFAAGLVADLAPPDHATRMTFLRKRVRSERVPLADEGPLERLAAAIPGSLRDLQGALIRFVALGSLEARPLDGHLVDEVLRKLYPGRRAPCGPRSIEDVQRAVCDRFGVTLEDLRSPSRVARLAWPRQVAMYLSRELTDESLPAIGRAFDRNHTTVISACRRASERLATDPEAVQAVDSIAERLRPA